MAPQTTACILRQTHRAGAQAALDAVCMQAVYTTTTARRTVAASRLDAEPDGVWAAARSSDLLLLDTTDKPITKSIVWRGVKRTLNLPSHGLVEVSGTQAQ